MNKNKFITSARKAKKTDIINQELYTFIIIADTPGYRMKSYGPTSLITLNKNKLIDIQIEAISKSFSNYEIILCCGQDIDKVYRHIKNNYYDRNIRIVENQIYNNSNSCESVRLSINNTMNDKIYILDGNLLIYSDLFNNKIKESYVYVEENPCENLEVGININENDFVEHFSYGASRVWSEIAYMADKSTIECFKKIINNIDFKNKFIFEALNELIKTKQDMNYVVNTSPVKKINNIKTYHNVRELI